MLFQVLWEYYGTRIRSLSRTSNHSITVQRHWHWHSTLLYIITTKSIQLKWKLKRQKGAHWAVLAAGRRARSSRRVFWLDPLHPPSDAGNTSGPCFGVPEVSQIQSPARTVLLDPGNQADHTMRRRFLSCWQNYPTTLLMRERLYGFYYCCERPYRSVDNCFRLFFYLGEIYRNVSSTYIIVLCPLHIFV